MNDTILTDQVSIVLSKETHDLLKAITSKLGWTKSEFIRVLLKQELEGMKDEVLKDEY
ncbi:hypothetical protein ACFLYZ_01240 [Thermodesulfobacteriota bacterium]